MPIIGAMVRYSFFLNRELASGLKALKSRDGISESEAIRRAITAFLEAKGVSTGPTKGANRPAKKR
jgi:hypothetical protein